MTATKDKPRVLITGAAGRIGRAVATGLAADYEIAGLDLVPGRWVTRRGSVTDAGIVAAALAGVAAVVHCAAYHAPHVGRVSAARFREVNVGGTERLLDACLHHRIERLVFTSTTSLYGAAMATEDHAVWVDEDLEPAPRDVYDETKIAAERACAAATGAGLSCISLRMSRCFPEPPRLMAVYRLYRGVDARDVAAAHALALAAPTGGYQVYNVSAASPFRRSDLGELKRDADQVIRRYHPWAAAAFARRGWRLPRSIDRVYAIDRAASELNYRPRYNFESLFAGAASGSPAPIAGG